jgi:hypothetical protein
MDWDASPDRERFGVRRLRVREPRRFGAATESDAASSIAVSDRFEQARVIPVDAVARWAERENVRLRRG